jgi:lipoprotein NlpD
MMSSLQAIDEKWNFQRMSLSSLRYVLTISVILLLSGCMSALEWPDDERTHVVQPGETLYSIATNRQLDYKELARWNGIDDSYFITPGQRLRLTPPGGSNGKNLPAPYAAPGDESQARVTALAKPMPSEFAWHWPVQGKMLQSFAATGSKGIDIQGELGQVIHAAAAGHVVYSGSGLLGYGQLIIIKHNKDFLSAYAYNRRLYVKEGDEVAAGQAIAEMGMGTTGVPTLHFEIRIAGKPVDPTLYLSPLG